MCSKSIIEILEGRSLKFNNEDTRTVSIDVVMVLSLLTLSIFIPSLSVSLNFSQVTESYDDHPYCLSSMSYVIAL